jgi:hypothetical protein
MRASRWHRWWAFALVSGAAACAHNPAPDGWLAPAVAAQNDPYGAWIVVATSDSSETSGEFLAVDRDTVFVLSIDSTVRALPRAAVRHAQIAFYESQWSQLALWTALGSVSTISNGILLVFTFPTWVIGGTIATSVDSRAPLREVARPEDWDTVRMYARFPAGLPEGLPRRLRPKPIL